MYNLSRTRCAAAYVFLSLIVLFVPSPTLAPENAATGHFEVYCDGVGLFLAKIDGAPASGKFVLFFEWGSTFGGDYVGQRKWSNAYVFRDGCLLDGKCESIADFL